jgi:hypothetical protein
MNRLIVADFSAVVMVRYWPLNLGDKDVPLAALFC